MKIKVSDLQPNPYRRLDRYPTDPIKIKILENSINQTCFWDNILARFEPTDNKKFQLAYGHNRLSALKNLNFKYVDIPVKHIDDAAMIQIMASENMDSWKSVPAVSFETILVSKDFIENEVSKYDSWTLFKVKGNSIIVSLIETEPNSEKTFNAIKGKSTTSVIIRKFLGDDWPHWKVQEVLASIRDDTINREALEEFKHLSLSAVFRKEMNNGNVPKEKQIEIAKKLIKKRSGINNTTGGATTTEKRKKVIDDIHSVAPEFFGDDYEIKAIKNKLDMWQKRVVALSHITFDLNKSLSEIDAMHIAGFEQFISVDKLDQLMREIKQLLPVLGINIKKYKEIV